MIRKTVDRAILRIAWRDARSQWKHLLLVGCGMAAGVAALVAILSFRNDLHLTLDRQAKELLGADLEIRQNEPHTPEVEAFIDSLGGTRSTSIEFSSMVSYGHEGEPRLSRIRAIEGEFPYYGKIRTDPAAAADRWQELGMALVDETVMKQLDLNPGDPIRVGRHLLSVAGALLEMPGENTSFSLFAPLVVIPKQVLAGSDLLQRGSQVRYSTHFLFEPGQDEKEWMEAVRSLALEHPLRYQTAETTRARFGRTADHLSRYLGLIGFIALFLGGLGVAAAIHLYIRHKRETVATLRCLGATSAQTRFIFTLQVAGLGLAGSIAGVLIGLFVQRLLPLLVRDLLPFGIVQEISVPALIAGLGSGTLVSLAFSLLPLATLTRISPLRVLRTGDRLPPDPALWNVRLLAAAVMLCLLALTLGWLLQDLRSAFLFVAGMVMVLLLLLGISWILIRTLRLLRLHSLPWVWRQGIAGLSRPGNATPLLLTALGTGTFLIGSLHLVQHSILHTIEERMGEEAPSLVLFDIQADQNEEILRMAHQDDARILHNVPIITMRLSHWKGREVAAVRQDTTSDVRNWVLTREYRASWRNHLTEAETVIEGEWIGRAEWDGAIPISLGEEIAKDLAVTIGDTLRFDLQGVPIDTRVASIREIDFQRPEPNFFLLFPEGVLDDAPRFYATTLKTDNPVSADRLLQKIVRQHPNISALDVGHLFDTVREFLEKVAAAIRFMALFTVLTAVMILSTTLYLNRYQRIRESVLLRILGASRKRVRNVQLVEFLLIGLSGTAAGLLLALLAGWLLSRFWFGFAFHPSTGALLGTALPLVLLTLLIGMSNTRLLLRKKPMELRPAE